MNNNTRNTRNTSDASNARDADVSRQAGAIDPDNPWGLLDAVCILGRHMKLAAGGRHTADDLLADMDRFGIAEALVLDATAREHHPADGNPLACAAAAESPRLHPAWSALPHAPADEQPDGEATLAAMQAAGVGATFLFPRHYGFRLVDWQVDDFIAPLAEAAAPVFINPNRVAATGESWDMTDWDDLVGFCRRHPTLPVVLTEWRFRQSNRAMYRALEACGNLRIELSGCWLNRCIEYVTRSFGAERLIFGSNWPRYAQGPTAATLAMAEISDADKRRIGGDNLRDLLNWHGRYARPAVTLDEPADDYARFARTGRRPAAMTFADNHGHMGGRSHWYHLPDCTLDDCVAEMDRLGVEKTCIFAFAGITGDERLGNDRTAEAVRRYGERFVGFTLLNPHRGEAWMLDELKRCQDLGLRGVKLIPHYQGYPETGEMIDLACRWAHEHRQIILNHSWGSPETLRRLIERYGEACFFTGHATDIYAELMREHENLYVCSCPLISPEACENLVAAIGADRLMFGSDMQDLPIAWGLGPILHARISPADKKRILGDNLRHVLRHYSVEP